MKATPSARPQLKETYGELWDRYVSDAFPKLQEDSGGELTYPGEEWGSENPGKLFSTISSCHPGWPIGTMPLRSAAEGVSTRNAFSQRTTTSECGASTLVETFSNRLQSG